VAAITKELIVSADDLGLTRGINRGIGHAHEHGIVTSASLLVNMPALEDALEMASDYPALDLGLHFNLVRGAPISDPSRVPSLVGHDGRFLQGLRPLVARLMAGLLDQADIERELDAQIRKARDLGADLSHIDSEKHVHFHPAVAEAVAGGAARNGIRALRLAGGLEPWRLFTDLLRPVRLAGTALLMAMGREALSRINGLRHPAHIRGILRGGRMDLTRLKDVLRTLPEGVSELVTHPGYATPELSSLTATSGGFSMAASRESEMRLLMHQDLPGLLEESGVRLITYRELAGK